MYFSSLYTIVFIVPYHSSAVFTYIFPYVMYMYFHISQIIILTTFWPWELFKLNVKNDANDNNDRHCSLSSARLEMHNEGWWSIVCHHKQVHHVLLESMPSAAKTQWKQIKKLSLAWLTTSVDTQSQHYWQQRSITQ